MIACINVRLDNDLVLLNIGPVTVQEIHVVTYLMSAVITYTTKY